MRSKIVAMLYLCLIALSSSCFAMTFSQPIKLGEFFQTQAKGAPGFVIKGATYNKGDYYTKFDKNNKATYGKGVACFGNGDDALYLHYNAYNTALYDPHTHGTTGNGDTARLGSKNILNIPAPGNRESGEMETAIPEKRKPMFRRNGNRLAPFL